MARYTGPMTKKSRRLGVDLVGGDKAFERRPYPPGVHGKGRTKESEYSLQLREKQQARQFVVHGHFIVNGHKVNIPSYRVTAHDVIDLVPKVRETTPHIINRET